jgi:hypothetical protein
MMSSLVEKSDEKPVPHVGYTDSDYLFGIFKLFLIVSLSLSCNVILLETYNIT